MPGLQKTVIDKNVGRKKLLNAFFSGKNIHSLYPSTLTLEYDNVSEGILRDFKNFVDVVVYPQGKTAKILTPTEQTYVGVIQSVVEEIKKMAQVVGYKKIPNSEEAYKKMLFEVNKKMDEVYKITIHERYLGQIFPRETEKRFISRLWGR